MIDILTQINDLEGKICASPVTAEQIIRTQQDLKLSGFPLIPDDYVKFLHHFNGVCWDDSCAYGINPETGNNDLLAANKNFFSPQEGKIILGEDDFDFLAYNPQTQTYEIIDREDFSLLQSYTKLETALCCLLKLEFS